MNYGKRINEAKIIKGIVDDLDKGMGMASVTIRSGKRIFSVLMPTSEVLSSGVEKDRPVFCLIQGKDITLFRDPVEFFRRYGANRSELEFFTPSECLS
ncbi:hypothetical protein [Desulfurispira natronophila]|uniref:Uncharacterized protein n=1 Tax=Desulfurispira natronophila TaxID=682562 RepID=A0A7W8DGN9_9BACT|nr:hypothetical protein [Desulfurispira natronophila]MBB5021615.1 hypothetical protein [Desulfurispira natronophila]